MADFSLTHTADGFDLTVANGLVAEEPWLDTDVVQSLFGGNADDDGSSATAERQYWGNRLRGSDADRLRGRFQSLIHRKPVTPAKLRELEDAAASDLGWMVAAGLLRGVSVDASMPAVHRVRVEISLATGDGVVSRGYEVPVS